MSGRASVPDATVRTWWQAGAWTRVVPVLRHGTRVALTKWRGLSADDRDDIVSHVLWRAWTAPTVPDRPTAWAAAVACNAARDLLKSAPRRWVRDAATMADLPAADQDWRTDAVRDAALWAAVDALPPLYRAPVLHRFRDGWGHEAIARHLGTNAGVSRMRVTRGLQQLRAALSPSPLAA